MAFSAPAELSTKKAAIQTAITTHGKRTTNAVYFLTGMAASVQAVLYGFGGLEAHPAGQPASGTKIAGDSVASLYCDPHLPPGWTGLTIKGVRFRGKTLDVVISQDNKLQTIIH